MGLSLIIRWDPLLLFCRGLLEPSACGSSAVVSVRASSLCSLPLSPFILKHTPQTWMFTWLNSLSTFTRAHTKYRTPYSVFKVPYQDVPFGFPFYGTELLLGRGLWILQTNLPSKIVRKQTEWVFVLSMYTTK